MAGIFLQQTKVFNRAPIALSVFFDGERHNIPVGFSEIPAITTYMAKNQNPIMGSGDAANPNVDGTQYLITVEHEDAGYGVPLTEEEWADHLGKPARVNEQAAFEEKYSGDPKAKLVVRGAGRKSTAQNRYEAQQSYRGKAEFTSKES
jgi:hypothetical protein